MSLSTVAAIIVQTPKVFSWLGHMPVMTWSLNQLLEVRGVDRIVCVAVPDLAARAGRILVKDEIEVTTIPDNVKDQTTLHKWLCAANGPAATADVLVAIKPTAPFLPSAKIEACLHKVKRCKNCDHCTLHRYATVDSLQVFKVQAVIESVALQRAAVPVSLIESLDVTDPEGLRVATALVVSGTA